MKSKKERILEVALTNFANEGYDATSTQKIANKAGVSEGLIFKHFKNKQGVLLYLLSQLELQIQSNIDPIIKSDDPYFVLRETIEIPFNIPKNEYDYWRLYFKMKWTENYQAPISIQILGEKLLWAFQVLKYEEPLFEARLLEKTLDGVFIAILTESYWDIQPLENLLFQKYQLK